MDCDSKGKCVILSQINTGILEISKNYGKSFDSKLDTFHKILSCSLAPDCSEIYILSRNKSNSNVCIEVYKSIIPIGQKGNGILEVQGMADLSGNINISSVGSACFSEISGSNIQTNKIVVSSITGSSEFIDRSYISNLSSSFCNFDNVVVSQLTGTSASFLSITGTTISASQITCKTGNFDSIRVSRGIQPIASGVILGSDEYNNCKFADSSPQNSYFRMDSSNRNALFKVCNNPSSNSMFQINGIADSNSVSTGALTVNGGVGIAKSLHASSAHIGNLSATKLNIPISTTGIPTIGSVYFEYRKFENFYLEW